MNNANIATSVASDGVVTVAATRDFPTASSFTTKVVIARKADTTAYTAGDVVGPTAAAIEFPNMGTPDRHIMITDVDFRIDLTAVPASMTSFRLHLYNVTPPSALADNAAWDLPAGDRASYLGYIDLGTPVDVGSTLYIQTSAVNKKVALASSSLFGYLVTNGGYTPASGTTHAIRLNAIGM